MQFHVQTIWKSPPLPYGLNVFEADHSPAVHVTLWRLVDIICHTRLLKTWVAIEKLEYMYSSE